MTESSGTLELSVAEMTYGASALARTAEGQVAFVDDGLPGERVRARIGTRRRKYLQTKVVEVLDPSPTRVARPVPTSLTAAGASGSTPRTRRSWR